MEPNALGYCTVVYCGMGPLFYWGTLIPGGRFPLCGAHVAAFVPHLEPLVGLLDTLRLDVVVPSEFVQRLLPGLVDSMAVWQYGSMSHVATQNAAG